MKLLREDKGKKRKKIKKRNEKSNNECVKCLYLCYGFVPGPPSPCSRCDGGPPGSSVRPLLPESAHGRHRVVGDVRGFRAAPAGVQPGGPPFIAASRGVTSLRPARPCRRARCGRAVAMRVPRGSPGSPRAPWPPAGRRDASRGCDDRSTPCGATAHGAAAPVCPYAAPQGRSSRRWVRCSPMSGGDAFGPRSVRR
jgi:hypothetical protein